MLLVHAGGSGQPRQPGQPGQPRQPGQPGHGEDGRQQATVAAAERWAESGVAALSVVPLERGWVAVVPTTGASAVAAPYDEALPLLLNRPLPHRLRPAIGLGVMGRRAVVSVTPSGWRAVRRWLVWQPGSAVVHPGGLAVARLADLVRAAGVTDPSAVAGLADVLHDPGGDAYSLVTDVLVALDLPGTELVEAHFFAAGRPGVVSVEPAAVAVRRFGKAVRDDVTWRDELDGSGR